MILRHLLLTIVGTVVAIVVASVGIALVWGDGSAQGILEYAWICSAAVAGIGLLARSGAATGTDPIRHEGVVASSHDPDAYLEADARDVQTGFSFGTVVMLTSCVCFIAVLLVLNYFFE